MVQDIFLELIMHCHHLTRKSDGLPTGAVSGFCSMLFKLLEDSKSDQNLQKPTHFAVIFDSARKTFRNDIYSDYKANRSEAPDDLAPQFEYIRKSVLAFNFLQLIYLIMKQMI